MATNAEILRACLPVPIMAGFGPGRILARWAEMVPEIR